MTDPVRRMLCNAPCDMEALWQIMWLEGFVTNHMEVFNQNSITKYIKQASLIRFRPVFIFSNGKFNKIRTTTG